MRSRKAAVQAIEQEVRALAALGLDPEARHRYLWRRSLDSACPYHRLIANPDDPSTWSGLLVFPPERS